MSITVASAPLIVLFVAISLHIFQGFKEFIFSILLVHVVTYMQFLLALVFCETLLAQSAIRSRALMFNSTSVFQFRNNY